MLEDPSGRLVGIEIKSAFQVKSEDFKGMRVLAEDAKDKFHRGIVLYGGEEVVPFAANMTAVPLSALWRSLGRK